MKKIIKTETISFYCHVRVMIFNVYDTQSNNYIVTNSNNVIINSSKQTKTPLLPKIKINKNITTERKKKICKIKTHYSHFPVLSM